jgi:hypothetical protein
VHNTLYGANKTHTNSMEGTHTKGVKKPLLFAAIAKAAKSDSQGTAKLPVPTVFGIQETAKHLERSSRESAAQFQKGNYFRVVPTFSSKECTNAKIWTADPFTLKLSRVLYACRQPVRFRNSPLTIVEAREAIELHGRILRGEVGVQSLHLCHTLLLWLSFFITLVCVFRH